MAFSATKSFKSILISCGILIGQMTGVFAADPLEENSPSEMIMITHVNVLSMTNEEILKDRTVLITDGKIKAITRAKNAKTPKNAQIIDGSGKYVMPGLFDMHVHLGLPMLNDPNPEVMQDEHIAAIEDELKLYVANGVTTVRNMWGSPVHLLLRKKVEEKQIIGPRIFTASPMMDSDPRFWATSQRISSRQEAHKAVIDAVGEEYDFIKVYSSLGKVEYDEILKTSKELGITVAGHVNSHIDLQYAIKSGQKSTEHLLGYERALTSGLDIPADVKGYALWAYADLSRIDSLARETAAGGLWNCPTLTVLDNFMEESKEDAYLNQPKIKLAPEILQEMWRHDPILPRFDEDYRRAVRDTREKRLKLVYALHKAGAGLLLGTDSAAALVMPGFSIHNELQEFVAAGLSPYSALRAGTIDASEFLGVADQQGTIEVGKRADLLLLDGNPLEDVANVKRLSGVVLNGDWYDAEALDRMLSGMNSGKLSN